MLMYWSYLLPITCTRDREGGATRRRGGANDLARREVASGAQRRADAGASAPVPADNPINLPTSRPSARRPLVLSLLFAGQTAAWPCLSFLARLSTPASSRHTGLLAPAPTPAAANQPKPPSNDYRASNDRYLPGGHPPTTAARYLATGEAPDWDNHVGGGACSWGRQQRGCSALDWPAALPCRHCSRQHKISRARAPGPGQRSGGADLARWGCGTCASFDFEPMWLLQLLR